jgi:hypothetical protein
MWDARIGGSVKASNGATLVETILFVVIGEGEVVVVVEPAACHLGGDSGGRTGARRTTQIGTGTCIRGGGTAHGTPGAGR